MHDLTAVVGAEYDLDQPVGTLTMGEDEKGIDAYAKSLALEPREEIAVNLVALYARNAKRDLAQQTIERYIANSKNPDSLVRAREALSMADLAEAVELAQTGKQEEATVLARSVHDSTESDEVKERAADLLRRLEAAKIIVKQVAELNRAIDLANAGHTKEALAAIDTLLPAITDIGLQANAKDLRVKLAAAGKKK